MLKRTSLRDQVRGTIINEVIEGNYQPGKKIVLASIAKKLDVSTTPIREAFTQLEHEGFLKVEPNRGFYITPLELDDASELYPIIWTLESLAMELTKDYSHAQIKALWDINERLSNSRNDPSEAVKYDTAWHSMLTCKCGNEILINKLKEFKRRAELYEFYFMKDSNQIPSSLGTHETIIKNIEAKDLTIAAKNLKGHWETSLTFLCEWLSKTES